MAKKMTAGSVFGMGNGQSAAVSLHDQLAASLASAGAIVDKIIDSGPEMPKLKKSEFGAIGEDCMKHLKMSEELDRAAKRDLKAIAIVNDAARQRIVELAMNLKPEVRNVAVDNEEGMKKLIEEIDKLRYSLFVASDEQDLVARYPNGNYVNIGKEQPLKKKESGQYKFGSIPETKYRWNVLSKLNTAIQALGFEAVAPGGKYINDAACQALMKAKKTGSTPATPGAANPMGRVEALIHQLTVALGKVDLTSADGESLVNKATMSILSVKAAQVNAAAGK